MTNNLLVGLLFVIVLQFCPYVFTLEESSALEKKCVEPKVDDVDIDYDWVLSNKEWYFPLQNKLELYRTGWDILQKPIKDITEEEINSACTRITWDGLTPTTHGFNGKKLTYEFTPMFDNTFLYTAAWRDGVGGKMYLTKTDNQNYIVFVKCWADGQMSWHVMSITKTLNTSIKSDIVKHLNTLGFDEKFLVEQNYEKCDFKKEEL